MSTVNKIRSTCSAFVRDDDGAITVDWIVLTAALVALGIGAAFYISSSVPIVADRTSDYMSNFDLDAPLSRDGDG
jgi:hypothetical protein